MSHRQIADALDMSLNGAGWAIRCELERSGMDNRIEYAMVQNTACARKVLRLANGRAAAIAGVDTKSASDASDMKGRDKRKRAKQKAEEKKQGK
jgi:hypothetical protein